MSEKASKERRQAKRSRQMLKFTKEYEMAPFEEHFIWYNDEVPESFKDKPPRRFATAEDYQARKPVKMYED